MMSEILIFAEFFYFLSVEPQIWLERTGHTQPFNKLNIILQYFIRIFYPVPTMKESDDKCLLSYILRPFSSSFVDISMPSVCMYAEPLFFNVGEIQEWALTAHYLV